MRSRANGEQNMTLPNFLIIGAAKSGTTSIARYLQSHPEVFMAGLSAQIQEPAFFSVPEAGGIIDPAAYEMLFAPAVGEKIRGEKSVAYIFDPGSSERITAALGMDVKMLAILRNPIDMIWSLWRFLRREGTEDLSFKDALAAEPERLNQGIRSRVNGSWTGNFAYVARACYAEQLKPYWERFGPERIRVYLFEEFFEPGLPLYPDLCRFLEIDDTHKPLQRRHNPGGELRSRWLHTALKQPGTWKEPLKLFLPRPLRERLSHAILRWNRAGRARKRETIPERSAFSLRERLYEENRKLETLLKRDLSSIWF